MGGGGDHPEHHQPRRDDRPGDAGTEDLVLAQVGEHFHAHFLQVLANGSEHGADGGIAGTDVVAEVPQAVFEMVGALPHHLPPVITVDNFLEGHLQGFHIGHREGLGEYLGPGVVGDPVAHLGAGGGVAADGSKGFGEGAEVEVDFLLDTQVIGGAPAFLADNADAVGIVDEYPGVVFAGQGGDTLQVGQVAGHAVDALGEDHHAAFAVLVDALENRLEVVHVIVTEESDIGFSGVGALGAESGIHDAGMGQLVHNQGIIGSGEGNDSSQDAHISVVEQEGIFLLGMLGQGFLQGQVIAGGAAHHPAAHRGTDRPLVGGFHGGGFDLRIMGQADIVVHRPHDILLTLVIHPGAREIVNHRKGKEAVTGGPETAEVTFICCAFVENVCH